MSPLFFSLTILLSSSLSAPVYGDESSQLKTFIVRVRSPDKARVTGLQQLEDWYKSFLPDSMTASSEPRIVYSYGDAMSGFAARLTEAEVKEMEKRDGFLKAYPDSTLSLLTTHSPSFLGLELGLGPWDFSNLGRGVIIGVLDTGVMAAHPSFGDDDMPPPPRRWKGTCKHGGAFRCNKKLIGARSFGSSSTLPAVDQEGHGTHTSSTAAGNFVHNASVFGSGNGTAAGMAPHAHLAIYKVGDDMECKMSDVVAGMDAAIKDRVDVISLSLAFSPVDYYADPLAIATFSAANKGIFVSCAAGNDGPSLGTVTNTAPWVLTVAASTMDRSFRVTVKLGDGQEFNGESVFQPDGFPSAMLPLVLADFDREERLDNLSRNTNRSHIEGKIVLCQLGETYPCNKNNFEAAGAAAMIAMNTQTDGYTIRPDWQVLPASNVSYNDGTKILSYIYSSSKPMASLTFKGTIIGVSPHPSIASFSSRGPNIVSPGILKPDITGPGVSIIGASPYHVGLPNATQGKLNFSIISGTSMSTPHLSGIAALVKSKHRNWSPAAIKSAIMTTADIVNHDGDPIKDEQLQPAGSFLMGAGHVNPSKAVDPGLVYDLGTKDYISYLCGLGYNDKEVEYVTGRKIACADTTKIKEVDLNYPSITVFLKSRGSIMLNRTVTNVGKAESVYKAEVENPKRVSITLQPDTLQFKEVNEKKNFTVIVSDNGGGGQEGSLKWVSGKYVVRSPIVIIADN